MSSSPSFNTFVSENQIVLERLYHACITELNDKITFEIFCIFAYNHSY